MVRNMNATASLNLTQRAYRCLRCLYLLAHANIGEIIHEADITTGPGEPSAGQMELDLLQEWGCLEGVSAYTIAIRHGGILEAEGVMKYPALARKYLGGYSEGDAALVVEREAMRYRTLRHLYAQALAEGTTDVLRQHAGVRAGARVEDDEEWEACDYLDFEGLADLRVNALIGITPAGMAEVERAVEDPDAPTEHFSLVVLQQFNAPVGAVVTGAGATVNVTQIVSGVVKSEEGGR
jgi:hypothetical protein